jgi:ATP-dependent RNA helicase DeaD
MYRLSWRSCLKDVSVLTATPALFGGLRIDPGIAEALTAIGYHQPTPIQAQAIPPLQDGRDVTGQARTGSGKTAGFGIPLLESVRPGERSVQGLVLVPTRELASQVALELTRLGAQTGVRVVAIYGGVGMGAQIAALRGNAHVVVGTPGRVIDHLTRGTLNLRAVRMVVLDEADRMLDVGFAPAIEDILRRTPTTRRTALFSATFPAAVEDLVAHHTRNPVRIVIDPPGTAIETLEQRFVRVDEEKAKSAALHEILIDTSCSLALVFRRTTHRADKLAKELEQRGFRVAVLHGRRSQTQRERALAALRAGELHALVATDIAARGLDITGLTHVVNYDLPDTAENYTHRIGRTARMGANGIAITLVSPDDEQALRDLTRRLPAATGVADSSSSRRQASGSRRRSHPVQPRRAAAATPVEAHSARQVPPPARAANAVVHRERARSTGEPVHKHPRRASYHVSTSAPAPVEVSDQTWYPFQMPPRKA